MTTRVPCHSVVAHTNITFYKVCFKHKKNKKIVKLAYGELQLPWGRLKDESEVKVWVCI